MITAKHVWNFLGTLLSPPVCMYCGGLLPTKELYCPDCYKQITPLVSHRLPITKKYDLKVFAVSEYKDPIKKLVLAKRWSNIVASYQLAELIWTFSTLKYQQFDCLVPVPLHWFRRVRRGFNQAQEIAQVLSTKSKIPVVNLLERVKHTAYQTDLAHDQRISNVKDSFTLSGHTTGLYKGKQIMLVDDVMTTGATLRAAARELIKLKPASVSAIVACRVV